ncbi:LacI family DNA-binding transcriptional regulator [Meridianimarinicoccus aquatilis]|uniref:LacI family DNA-binding transcriptional regulator n=1 Tax=Meridianimarinicoccus aquatilis TaxID=2552766 RepID=UPI001FB64318|nr:LacI family DNA-binding transcriptional regulator [Fluviibacterium aquatile]
MKLKVPTLSDVARHAGVSYATADRVVNARGRVAEKSASRVRAAIDELGYVRNVDAANLAQRRFYRFAIVLPVGSNAFFTRMRNLFLAAMEQLQAERVALEVIEVKAFHPSSLRAALDRLANDKVDGVALVGSEDATVVEAIEKLRKAKIPVMTLVSDVPGADRNAYVGIDNKVAGRTAGRLIALAHSSSRGRVVPIVGALSARDHADRISGMSEVLESQHDIAPVIEGYDQHDLVEARVAQVLEDDRDVTAIYSAGAGNAGLIRVLERLPECRRRPVAILHELAPHSRRALENGLIDIVIDQRPEDEMMRVVEGLRRLADRRALPVTDPIVPAIFVRENLPPLPLARTEREREDT